MDTEGSSRERQMRLLTLVLRCEAHSSTWPSWFLMKWTFLKLKCLRKRKQSLDSDPAQFTSSSYHKQSLLDVVHFSCTVVVYFCIVLNDDGVDMGNYCLFVILFIVFILWVILEELKSFRRMSGDGKTEFAHFSKSVVPAVSE